MIAAAPTACRARQIASTSADGANPHSTLAPVKMASPVMYRRRRPTMSATRPNTRIRAVLTSMKDSTIQDAAVASAEKCRATTGSATSRVEVLVPDSSTPRLVTDSTRHAYRA